jgi:hypothetical protein
MRKRIVQMSICVPCRIKILELPVVYGKSPSCFRSFRVLVVQFQKPPSCFVSSPSVARLFICLLIYLLRTYIFYFYFQTFFTTISTSVYITFYIFTAISKSVYITFIKLTILLYRLKLYLSKFSAQLGIKSVTNDVISSQRYYAHPRSSWFSVTSFDHCLIAKVLWIWPIEFIAIELCVLCGNGIISFVYVAVVDSKT